MKKPLFTIPLLLVMGFSLSVSAQVKRISPLNQAPSHLTTKPVLNNEPNGLINLQWEQPHTETMSDNGPSKTFIGFKGAIYDAGNSYLPAYFKNIKLKTSTTQIQVVLTNAKYEPLSAEEISAIRSIKTITPDVKLSYSIVQLQRMPYAQIYLFPIRKNPMTGQYEKLVSFSLDVQQSTGVATKRGRRQASFATNSILATGTWYKIGVAADGVYKLDYNFFKKLGYDMSSLQPANIRIYGNGGAMLPVMNNAPRPDDLEENAIYVQGQSDASFGQNDYVLFYGQSPNVWTFNANGDSRFHHAVNLYTDTTYYFITADLGPGKRISTENSSTLTPTDTVTSFDDYAYHELDQTNLIKSGNEWFGEYFDNTTSYNITFKFNNLITSSIYLNTALASRYSDTSTYRVSCNTGSTTLVAGSVSTTCYYCQYANMATGSFKFIPSSSGNSFTVNITKQTAGAIGWLYYVETNVRRQLTMDGDQMGFRNALSVGAGKISQYTISAYTPLQVWDVTNPQNVQAVTLSSPVTNTYRFVLPSDSLKQFIAFTGNSYLTATAMGPVPNQNLHNLPQADMVIITNPEFLTQAQQLADFHNSHDGLKVNVVTTSQVYNEFSSGRQDPVAIRDFCRMFYTRETDYASSLKYVLLFGDGSYDPKHRLGNNSNYLIAYESNNSFDPTSSCVSDDFYAVLDSDKGNLDIPDYTLDIGVGRFPVDNITEAQTVVNKVISYETGSGEPVNTTVSCCNQQTQYNMGNWRNSICFIAHDGDGDEHINQAEQLAQYVDTTYRNLNINKIYLDAYQMVQTPGGPRYPDVNTAIDNQMNQGLLIINYTGHGGVFGLATSRVLTFSDIYSWTNINKLSLFFTASCEFARYDDPEQVSAGELCLLSSTGGNIALMTTVRDVYSGGNFSLNQNFYNHLYSTLPDGTMPRMGDLFATAKNYTGPIVNSRMFALLGDPAVRLAYPQQRVYTTAINSVPVTSSQADTLKALAKVTISGFVGDTTGNLLSNFNGVLYPTVYDKPVTINTLDNLGGTNSPVIGFQLQNNNLFKGRISVANGKFSFSFVVPKDILYNYGYGKISYYAQNGSQDATGNYENILVGGSSSTAYNNGKGPQVKLFMNDSNFVFGGMTNENPQIFATVSDSNGVNTTGNGIGHDITAVLDNNTQNTIDLNNYYQPALNSYQKGIVNYPFSSLSPGKHSLSLRVWNVYNNSTQAYTEFTVEPKADLQLQHVLNYPDPFTTHTQFYFELNQVCDQLNVQIQIFTISGKLVKNILTSVKSDSFRYGSFQPIEWDGRDDYGDKVGNGVYIYHVKVRTSAGTVADSYQKLVIL